MCTYCTMLCMKLNMLGTWMKEHDLEDDQMAALVKADRTTISRLRRGKQRPSWELAANLERATKGGVPVASWAGSVAAE